MTKQAEKSKGQRLSEIFRHATRLPKRKSDKPSDQTKDAPELDRAFEPEGGFGGPEANKKKKGD